MKISSFVGIEYVSLNDKEINFIKKSITNVAKKYFDGFCKYKVNFRTYENYRNAIVVNASIEFKDMGVLRTDSKHCVKPYFIDFHVFKQNGYDESKCGKVYEWEEDYEPKLDITEYAAEVMLIGDFRRYHCSEIFYSTELLPISKPHGTELNDIDFDKDMEIIADYLKRSKPTKIKI
jgi:hypothetical protein